MRSKNVEFFFLLTHQLLWGSIYNDAHQISFIWIWSVCVRACARIQHTLRFFVNSRVDVRFAWACVECFRLSKGSIDNISSAHTHTHRVFADTGSGSGSVRLSCAYSCLFFFVFTFIFLVSLYTRFYPVCAQLMYHIFNLIWAILRGYYLAFNV